MSQQNPLTFITVAPILLGAMCLTISLLLLVIGLRRPYSRTHLTFALSAGAVAAATMLQSWVYTADSLEGFRLAFKWMIGFEAIFWLAAVWFIAFFTGIRNRWLPWLLTALFAFGGLFVHWLSPGGILLSEITQTRSTTLPWGEEIRLPVGPASPWRVVTDLAMAGFFILGFLGCRELFRRGAKAKAGMLCASLILLLIGAFQSSLVDLGILKVPYLFTYGYIGVVLIMSIELIREVFRAGELAHEVSNQEERWRSMCEKVSLVIVGLDPQGRVNYVNPYFEELTGFSREGVRGNQWIQEHVPKSSRDQISLLFSSEPVPDHHTCPILTNEGEERIIEWSNVALSDGDGHPTGILSIGADVTAKIESDRLRQKTIEELESLKDALKEENISLIEEVSSAGGFSEIIGESPVLKYVLHRIEEVAPTEATVLLEGETGVGKELVARAIHDRSTRKGRPMLKVDCASLPPGTLESELFGHEKGAYTGADRSRKGRFELANGGTVFLDEVGELPLEVQPKLLRVLQDGEFERMGSERTTRVDVRVIAATNRDLKKEVVEGRFRGDLFFRLNVFPISVPPLRSRKEDIPLLMAAFTEELARKHGKQIETVPRAVIEKLQDYEWPGNVRELQNILERAVITASGGSLRVPGELFGPRPETEVESSVGTTLREVERRHILDTLNSCSWKISGEKGAAELLGINPSTLRSRMQKLGIKKPSPEEE
jgi:PAS domain S-box-containing protein